MVGMPKKPKHPPETPPPPVSPPTPPESASGSRKPNRTGRAINVWLPSELFTAFERFRDAQRVQPRITDTVELALQEFLTREGFWPLKEEDE